MPGRGLPINALPTTLLNHDVAPDDRFVTIVTEFSGNSVGGNIIVVQNWSEDLRRLVPTN